MNLEKLKEEITFDEGKRNKPYKDILGHLTIGVGHNLDASGLCEAAIQAQLEFDINNCIEDLNRTIPWWINLDEARQRVFINMVFNLGITKFLTFKNTIEEVRKGNYEAAAERILQTPWASQVGIRAIRLSEMLRIGELK